MKIHFDHEKLDVYQAALRFCGWVGDLLTEITAKAAAKDQLDRASTSVPLNIAEGNGKYSVIDRARFLEISRGSSLECAACLDVLAVRKLISPEKAAEGKEQLVSVVQMLVGMLRKFSPKVPTVREEEAGYHQVEHE